MSSSSHLAHLLRGSRLSQVPKNSKPFVSSGAKYCPTHQIIETKPATLARQEWGLKAPIPSKVKSRYLVYNDLDTLERISTFEANGGSQWNRLRFQEMGLAPSYNPGKANPLFEGSSSSSDKTTPLSSLLKHDGETVSSPAVLTRKLSQLKSLRQEFKQWLLEKDPEALKNKTFGVKDMNENAVQFLTERLSATSRSSILDINKASFKNIVGTGGLTYNVGGKLRNTPNGVVQKTIVPGRFLNLDGNDRLAAIGGFVANASSSTPMSSKVAYNMGDFVRELTFPFDVQKVSVDESGKLMIRAQVISGVSQRIRGKIQGRSYQQRPLRSSKNASPAVSPIDPKMQADELLNILLSNFN